MDSSMESMSNRLMHQNNYTQLPRQSTTINRNNNLELSTQPFTNPNNTNAQISPKGGGIF